MDNESKYRRIDALRPKPSNEADNADIASSTVNNSIGGVTNLGSVTGASQSEPTVENGVQDEPVITSQPNSVLQPSTLAHGYIPIAPSTNRDADDDDDCCGDYDCWGCCSGTCDSCSECWTGEPSGYSRATRSYTTGRNDGYNVGGFSDSYTGDYTSGYINSGDDNPCSTSNYDNNCVSSSGDGCCDSGDGGGGDGGGGGDCGGGSCDC